jgi:rubrerythrin
MTLIMSDQFDARQALEIACQIEKNGAAFYRRAAEIVKHEQSRELLLELADMEDGHNLAFEDMKSALEGDDISLPNIENDIKKYLQIAASNCPFGEDQNPAAFFSENVGVKKVLQFALKAEFATIVYFTALLGNIPDGVDREKLKAIISEEQEHVVILNKKVIALISNHPENQQ